MNKASIRQARPSSAPRYMVALRQAIQAHQSGELERAELLYRRVLAVRPAQADALHFLGVLRHQQGDSAAAIEWVRRSLQAAPEHADFHSNLGNIHKECGQLDQAVVCYRRALALLPTHPQALGNLAVVLQARGETGPARAAYEKWLASYPDDGRGHYWFARFLCAYPQGREDIEQATECFRRAYEREPGNLRALECLGMALYGLGRTQQAAEVYREWLARDAADPIARHMLAACGAADAPARADDAYVRGVFDSFAASFDEQLLNKLAYRAPQLLLDALDGYDDPAQQVTGQRLAVLDAGCGTGLCGPLLRERARHLVGVDLSAGMLERARRRDCYDALWEEELTAHLLAHPAAYDLIVAADTLVYFGDLVQVLAAAAGALREGGRVAFTLEMATGEHADDGYLLAASGRYQHARSYVTRVLAESGFGGLRITPAILRREAGNDVHGWVVRARTSSAADPYDDRR